MEYKALKDIAKITMGQSPDSSSYNEDGDGMPFFQGNADFGEVYPNERIWCNDPKKTAAPGDILISVRAPIGSLNYAKNRCCIGRGLAAITIDDEAERNYVFHLLKAKNSDLNNQGTGSTFKAIGKAVLEDVQVPQISKEEQQKCMDMMDLLESIIRERKAQLSSLDELIKARFVELFGRPEDKKYPSVRLGDYARLQGGYAFKSKDFVDEGVPLVQIGNVNKDYLDWDVINAVPEEYIDKYSEFALRKDDLVMAMTRPIIKSLDSVKIAKVAEDDLPCLLNQRVGRFQINDKIHPVFLEILCKTDDFKDYVERMSGNSLQPNISSKQVEDYIIILPPIELQEKFAEFVKQVDKSKVVA